MNRIARLGLVALLVAGCAVIERKNKLAVAAVTGGGAAGKAAVWKNADADAAAKITSVRSFVESWGRHCREFHIRFRVGASRETLRRSACRAADGACAQSDR